MLRRACLVILSVLFGVVSGCASCSEETGGGGGTGDDGGTATADGGTGTMDGGTDGGTGTTDGGTATAPGTGGDTMVDGGEADSGGTGEVGPDACTLTGTDPSQIGGNGDSCFSPAGSGANVTVNVYTAKSDFMSALNGCGETITFEDVDVCASDPAEIAPDRYVPSFGVRIEANKSNKSEYVGTSFSFSDDYKPVSGARQFASGNPNNEQGTSNDVSLTFPVSGSGNRVAGIGAHFIDADFPGYQQSSMSVAGAQGNTLKSKDVTTNDAEAKFVGFVAVDGNGNPVAALKKATLVIGSGWPGTNSNEGVTVDDIVVSTK